MKLLMVTSETVPFSKSGGLADVVGALSFALSKKDINVSVLMPLYGSIDKEKFTPYCSVKVPLFGGQRLVEIFKQTIDKVVFYAVSDPVFTKRIGIYGDTSFTPYQDNALRFSILSQAAVVLADKLKVDIVHAHDWATGLVPYLMKYNKSKAKSVYTIHNLAYQGDFSKYDFMFSGCTATPACFMPNGQEKRFNMMKTALEYADAITTVSPTYAEEIQTKDFGCNLDQLLQKKKAILSGIINGIDVTDWDPNTDSNFKTHFNAEDLSGKKKLKAAIQKEMGLKVDENIPLISMISRIADQKGFPELLDGEECALETLLKKNDAQFIIVGTGDERYEQKLKALDKLYDNLSVNILFSNKVAHRVEGGSDFFLMPSRYEPCGLNQLYSLRYGTIPIARKTGGLADSIVNILENNEKGTGFLFEEMNSQSIIEIVSKAISFYNDCKDQVILARMRGMHRDSSWDASASEYFKLYCLL